MEKIKELIFKPKWQHRNPEVRKREVADSDDPRLIEALPELARSDESPKVRLQAVKRLNDLYHLMRIATEDEDTQVREQAYRNYRAMLSGEHPQPAPMAECLEIVPRLDDDDLIEYLARNAVDERIRTEAVRKIDKPGLLGDIAINDESPAIRRLAVDRIDQRSTLERVAEALRKHDKRTYHQVQRKLATGDSDAGTEAAAAQARATCEAMEELSRSGALKDEKREKLDALEDQWKSIPEEARSGFHKRFDGARRIVLKTLQTADQTGDDSPELKALRIEFEGALTDAGGFGETSPLRQIEPLIDRLRKLRPPVEEKLDADARKRLKAAIRRLESLREKVLESQPVNQDLLKLCEEIDAVGGRHLTPRKLGKLQERWDGAWSRLTHPTQNDHGLAERFRTRMSSLENKLAQRQEEREQALEQIDDKVAALEQALDDGDLSAAAKAQGRVLEALKRIGSHPKVDDTDFRARLNTAKGRLHELRDWQHWANNKIRVSLCEEAEALPAAGLHPDAVTQKLKSLRAQWNELNESERLPGDHPKKMPAPGLYRRFQAASDKAFKPAKEFFEKRAEVRQQHLDRMTRLAEEIEAAVEDKSLEDQKRLERLVRDGRRALRDLNNIPPRKRGPMSKRLREGANALDERLEDQYQIIERRKQRIIDEVAALDPEADLEQAIEAAKDAQRRWQAAGHTRRRREQKLWKEFRKASDRIFEFRDEQIAEERAETQARYDELDRILKEAEALTRRRGEALAEAAGELNRLQDEWRKVGLAHRGREQRFQSLRQKVESQIAQMEADRMLDSRRTCRKLTALCHQAESRWFGESPDLEELRRQGDSLAREGEAHPLLIERWQTALEGDRPKDLDTAAENAAAEAREVLIALEFLGGIESPDEDKDQRMNYQVKRLSRRMAGEDTESLEDETERLEQQWYACGPLAPETAKAFSKRFDKVIKALDKQLVNS